MDPATERLIQSLAELARATCELPDGSLENPNGSGTYRELLELLEQHGRVEITAREGRTVRGRWK